MTASNYSVIISDIIEQEKQVIGPVAVQKAREVPGLTLDNEGNVTAIEGDKKEIVGKLVEKYETIVGEAVASAIRREQEEGDLPDLPANVRKYLS